MALDKQSLEQVLRTPKHQDVTESPLVKTVIINDPANAAEFVEALEWSETLEAHNARRILCLFDAKAVPYLLAKLPTASANTRKEGLEIFWALLAGEDHWTVREVLSQIKADLTHLLNDTQPLPDNMPEYIERDFQGRICDLAFMVTQQLIDPQYDQSLFRSLDDHGRNEQIKRLKARSFGSLVA